MGILDFINQYVDLGKILSGALAILIGLFVFSSNSKHISNDKFAVRVVSVLLIMLGAFVFFIGIRAVDFNSAATVAFTIMFIGFAWSMGAKGLTATLVGLALSLVGLLVLLSLASALPTDNLVGNTLKDWGNGIRDLVETGRDRAL